MIGEAQALLRNGDNVGAMGYYNKVLHIDPQKAALIDKAEDPSIKPIAKWGSFGIDDGQFYNPTGIAVDSSGNVYVADSDNMRIQKFDSNGTFITKWDSFGEWRFGIDDGQFYNPTGIAVDSSGNVYVRDNLRIQIFSPLSLKDTSALINKGAALSNLGNYTGAIQYYDKALAINSTDTDILNGKGLSLLYLQNNTEAIQYFDKAFSINSTDVSPLVNKGMALDNMGKHTEAIQYFDKALKSKYFDKALKVDPNNYSILEGKGEALSGIGNYTQALQYFDKALAKSPISIELFYDKANALSKLGNRGEGITYYDKILSINPSDEMALNGKKRLAQEYVAK